MLTVHDELVLEVPLGERDRVQPVVCEVMERVTELRVPARGRRRLGPDVGRHEIAPACGSRRAQGPASCSRCCWFDLMFDVQARGHSGELPAEVRDSIAAYYRRVTTAARPMNRLIAAVMVVTLGSLVGVIVQGDTTRLVGVARARARRVRCRTRSSAHGAARRPARHAGRHGGAAVVASHAASCATTCSASSAIGRRARASNSPADRNRRSARA